MINDLPAQLPDLGIGPPRGIRCRADRPAVQIHHQQRSVAAAREGPLSVSDDPVGAAVATVGQDFLAQAPIDGAAFTLGSTNVARELVWASDDAAQTLAQLQYSLGDGPARTALASDRPVLIGDLSGPEAMARWPIFTAAAAGLRAGALFVFPLQVGAIIAGTCDAYRQQAGLPDRSDLTRLLRAVDRATLALLTSPDGVDTPGPGIAWLERHSTTRAVVHQATGMLIVQLGVNAAEAFARLRAHAYAHGHDIEDVATAVVAHQLRLEKDPSR